MFYPEYVLASDGKNHLVVYTRREILPLCAMITWCPDKVRLIKKEINVYDINCLHCLQYAIELKESSDREV